MPSVWLSAEGLVGGVGGGGEVGCAVWSAGGMVGAGRGGADVGACGGGEVGAVGVGAAAGGVAGAGVAVWVLPTRSACEAACTTGSSLSASAFACAAP